MRFPDPRDIERLVAPLAGERVLVALDVDGTLVDYTGEMAPKVHDVLNRVRAAGHHVVIATGRSLRDTVPIVRLAGVSEGWAVSANGAITAQIDGPDESHVQIADTVTFAPREALQAMHRAVPEARFLVEKADGSLLASAAFDDVGYGLMTTHAPIEELLEQDSVVRVAVYAPDIPSDEFAAIVREAGVQGCEYAVGFSSWLDMSAPGVTKASALEALRAQLGVDPAHTLAIGDGSNDLDMLAWARASFAMGQATQPVKDAAAAVTGTIAEHGAASVLAGLLR